MANLLSRKSLPRENFIPQTTSDGDNRLWGEQIFDRNYFQRQIHTELNKYWHNICINQSNMFILNFCWNPCSKLFLCSDALLIQRGDFVRKKLELQPPWPLINKIRQIFGIIFNKSWKCLNQCFAKSLSLATTLALKLSKNHCDIEQISTENTYHGCKI